MQQRPDAAVARSRRLIAAAGLAGLALSAASPAGAAICEVYRQPLAFAADASIEMIVLSGMDCRIQFPPEEQFNIERNELTARPLHGGARVQAPASAYYRSNPGYKGRDRFSFTLCGAKGGKEGCSTIRVFVIVR
jgi:hypothetical protein